METDAALLKRYADARDGLAFAELVRRYAGMVYGTCLRMTNNHHLAEDASQECFLALAREARVIRSSLPGWLHRTAVNRVAMNARTEARRRKREEARSRTTGAQESEREPTWAEVGPQVDTALAQLPEKLSEPLILHFFHQKTQAEIGESLGIDRSTVSRRINRGIDKLRGKLRKAGIALSVGLLSALMASNAAQAAPATLVIALGKMAMSGVGGASAGTAAGTASGTATAAATGGIGIVKLSLIGLATAAVVTTFVVVTQVARQEPTAPETEQPTVAQIRPETPVAAAEAFTAENWQALLARALAAEAEIRAARNELEIVHETLPLPEEAKNAMLSRVLDEDLVKKLDQQYTYGQTRRRKTIVAFADDKFRIERDSPLSVTNETAPDVPKPRETIVMDGKTLLEYETSLNRYRINLLPQDTTSHPYYDDYQEFVTLLKPFTTLLARCAFTQAYLPGNENGGHGIEFSVPRNARLVPASGQEPMKSAGDENGRVADAVLEFAIPDDVRFFGVNWQCRTVRAWVIAGGPVLLRLEFRDEQGRLMLRVTRTDFTPMRVLERNARGESVRWSYGDDSDMNKPATWYAGRETQEYWSIENPNGTLLKTANIVVIKDDAVPRGEVDETFARLFELAVSPDAEIFDNRPSEVIEALRYREEFLPEGFTLKPRGTEFPNNPGTVPAEELDRIQKMYDCEARPTQAYACVFEAENSKLSLGYVVFRADSAEEADELGQAIRKARTPAPDGAFVRVYQVYENVLYVSGARGTVRQGEELAAKLDQVLGIGPR